jgi:hypothetical protein
MREDHIAVNGYICYVYLLYRGKSLYGRMFVCPSERTREVQITSNSIGIWHVACRILPKWIFAGHMLKITRRGNNRSNTPFLVGQNLYGGHIYGPT